MIFHCTKALAAKLPSVSPTPLTDANPLGSWHAHLHVIDRRQCIMFCHDTTRFVLFEAGLKKEQFQNLGKFHKELYLAALIAMGVPEATLKRVELAMGPALFDTATDRSVLGTLNQSRFEFDFFLDDYTNILEVDPLIAAKWFNHRPLTARGAWLWADKEMLALVSSL
ncbi:hypothetical protein SAMN02745119_00843 [Trichlorobacter thiogenes]|uniref:DUF6933 domain-containing protein n=1 Tax=Trichlorobacter thiogenes TaxID=115783 RepID=A0A1T4L9E6_9BACT|nr:hypothetical protein [Trichlorobacter thiogenes]SJZ51316.1 hypothetical protein SAMN02745119_00843 [Trichlorobacter thiogenes]